MLGVDTINTTGFVNYKFAHCPFYLLWGHNYITKVSRLIYIIYNVNWLINRVENITSFESTFIANCCESAIRHNGHVPAVELAFDKQDKALVTSIEEMWNPFLGVSAGLHALYSKEIIEDTVVRIIKNIETIDETLHSEYVEQRLVKATTAISHPLSKQQLPLFSSARGEPKFDSTDDSGQGDTCILCRYHGIDIHVLDLKDAHPGPGTIMKSSAWTGVQLTFAVIINACM